MSTQGATIRAAAGARVGTTRTFELLGLILTRELRLTWLIFTKELRELLVSRALWAMVVVSALLVGFTFTQAVRLFSEASASALRLPQLAPNQNPLDGIVIRVFSAVYLTNTFLLPFVAIRAIGNEKQTGALKFALQLPVGIYRLVAVKLLALLVGWTIALLPAVSALAIWSGLLGGHLYWPELASVLLGHALYALVIAGVSFLAAALTESAATAAIVALAFTLGSWVLEFAGASATGLLRAVAAFSLTPALRGLEQGLIGSPTAIAMAVLATGFLALTVVWLPPGVARRTKLVRTGAVAGVAAQALLLAVQLPIYVDVSEDQRNSFNPADVRALRQMNRELRIDVNLATNDPRLLDLQRNVLSKLQRTAPHVTIRYVETSTSGLLGGTTGANYGLNTYTYGGKQGSTRATTARQVLPLIEALAGLTVAPDPVRRYPGYPLVTSADGAAVWFYAALPLLAVAGWWYFQQPPALRGLLHVQVVQPRERFTTLRRASIATVVALVAMQCVPYGRNHTNVGLTAAARPIPPAALSQWCPVTFPPGSASTMSLGAFRERLGSLQTNIDASLTGFAVRDVAMVRTQYALLTVNYGGVSNELAQLYPLRCPRLLADRIDADAAMLGQQIDASAARVALTALRAGLVSVADDLDQRIRQASPNGVVGNQDEATADVPTVTGVPAWDSQRTQELATRACGGCHSNAPGWSWYANVAPLSWAVQRNVDAGRAALNMSEWDTPQPNAIQAVASVENRRMPPAWAGVFDSRLQLSDAERAELVGGLHASINSP